MGFAPFVPAELRASFDLVGFDPRRTQHGAACFGNPRQWLPVFHTVRLSDHGRAGGDLEATDEIPGGRCEQRGTRLIDP